MLIVRKRKGSGFPDTRSIALPYPLIQRSLRQPLLRDLLVTVIGCCGPAAGHYWGEPPGVGLYNIHYCISEKGFLQSQERVWELSADTAFFVPPNLPEMHGASKDRPWSFYWMYFCGAQAGEYYRALQVSQRQPLIHLPRNQEIISALEAIIAAMTAVHTYANLLTASTALSRFLSLANVQRRSSEHHNRTVEEKIQLTVQFMKQNLGRFIMAGELARLVGMSGTHYRMAFFEHLGLSPIAYFNRMKMQKANQLLLETDLPLKGIAGALGFEDEFYFSRLFRKINGMPPIHWRKYRMSHTQRKG